ncbi:MAG TPA: rhomboid family intramembrane serine protease [Clostridiaceae bacterium]|nr:rhomboid family intramembrane serine protease [Clostridiaceae bacterium]
MNDEYYNGYDTEESYQPIEPEVFKPVKPVRSRPLFTYILLAVNILIWILTEYYGNKYDVNAHLKFGAKFNPLIMSGEYWRLVTPIFLHGDIIHLLMNSYFLYAVGPTVERIFGKFKFITIYLIAGIIGNVASFVFSTSLSVGASGSLFGLMGALLYVIRKDKRIFRSSFGINVILTIGINLIYGFMNRAQIDNFAHVGGLIGGYIAARMTGIIWERKSFGERIQAFILIAVLIFGGIFAGFNSPANIEFKNRYELSIKADKLIDDAIASFNEKNYSKSEELSKELLEISGSNTNVRRIALDLLASSLINQRKNTQAVKYAKELVELNPERGHYLLGLSFYNLGREDDAIIELKKAYELNPLNTHAKELLDELSGES